MSDTNVSEEELDLLPEYCHYEDEGCWLAASCLRCGFSECVYDGPRGKQQVLTALRDREIRRRHQKGGKVSRLAARYGLSERTVARIVRDGRNRRRRRRKALKAKH